MTDFVEVGVMISVMALQRTSAVAAVCIFDVRLDKCVDRLLDRLEVLVEAVRGGVVEVHDAVEDVAERLLRLPDAQHLFVGLLHFLCKMMNSGSEEAKSPRGNGSSDKEEGVSVHENQFNFLCFLFITLVNFFASGGRIRL